jgi:phage gp45-like
VKIRAGTIKQTSNNASMMQQIQATGIAGEVVDNVDNFQPYGFNTVSVAADPGTGQGSEVILADIFGTGNATIVASTDRRYRPKTGFQGDVMLYGKHDISTADTETATQRITFTDDGTDNYRFVLKLANTKLQIKSDGSTLLTNGSGNIQLNADGSFSLSGSNIVINGPLTVLGDIQTFGTLKNNGVNVGNIHKHTSTTVGTDTSVPH